MSAKDRAPYPGPQKSIITNNLHIEFDTFAPPAIFEIWAPSGPWIYTEALWYTRAPRAVVHAAPVVCMIMGVYTGAVVRAVAVVVATPARAGLAWLM